MEFLTQRWTRFASDLGKDDWIVMLIVTAIVLIIGVVLLIVGLFVAKTRKLIQDTPTSNARELQPGFRELKGKVAPIVTLQSPISRKDCVYYKATVEEYRSSGKSGSWVTVATKTNTADFLLDDQYGKVLLTAANFAKANLDLKVDKTSQQGMLNELPPDVKTFLEQNNIRSKGLLFKKQLKISEIFLEPGDPLYVLGWAENVSHSSGARYSMRKEKGKPFLISDKGEEALLKSYLTSQIALFIIAGLLLLGPVVFFGLKIFVL